MYPGIFLNQFYSSLYKIICIVNNRIQKTLYDNMRSRYIGHGLILKSVKAQRSLTSYL